MDAIGRYFDHAVSLLKEILLTQGDRLEEAAQIMASCLMDGGLIYAFGTGHAHMLAEELFYRAGGLAAVYPILDEKLMLHIDASGSTEVERTSGYAGQLLDKYPVKPGDVMIVCSNSGRNAAPVEMALCARARGLRVIALTNIRHSTSVSSNNPSGKKLMDAAELVLDNCGCYGDTAFDVCGKRMGATSTFAGAAILQALSCRTAEIISATGYAPEVFISSNIGGNGGENEAVLEKYRQRVHCL